LDPDSLTAAASDEQALKGRFVRTVCLVVIGASLVYLTTVPWLDGRLPRQFIGAVLFVLVCLVALVLQHRRKTQAAGLVVSYGMCGGALLAGVLAGTVRTTSIYSLIVVIGMVGWLAGPRHALFVAALAIAGALGITVAAERGLLPVAQPPGPYAIWLAVALLLAVSAIFTRFLFGAFQTQLGRARKLGAILARQVRETRTDEAKLRLVAENVPGMVIHTRDQRCVYANKQYADFVGMTQAGVLGKHVRDLVGEAAYEGIAHYLERANNDERIAYRRQARKADGTEITIEVSLVPEFDENGQVVGEFAFIQDVSEQLQRENALRLSEDKFSKAFNASPLAFGISRLADGRIIEVNEAWVRMNGWTRDEAIGKTAVELGVWQNPQQREAWLRIQTEQGRVSNLPIVLRTKSGALRETLFSSEQIDLAGEPCILIMRVDLTERLEAERALRESETLLRIAVSGGNIGLWEWDIATDTLNWNSRLRAIFGLAPDDSALTLPRFLAAIHADDLEATRRAIMASLDGKAEFDHEYRIVRPDGAVRWIVARGRGEYDEAGTPVRMTGAAFDNTERKQAEAAQRESQERFARIFSASPVNILIRHKESGRYLDVNDTFTRNFGWTRQEVIGHTSAEIGIWPSAAERERWGDALNRHGAIRDYEANLLTKSGEVRQAIISAETIDIGGESYILSLIHDITERMRAEETLRESEARLGEAQRIGHIGSWTLDLASQRLHWTDELYRIYECRPDEFGGTWDALLERMHPDDQEAAHRIFRESTDTGKTFEFDHRVLASGGRVKHLHVRWEIFSDEQGKPAHARGTAQDVTERVLALAEIERLNAELETRVQQRTAELQAANRELESFAYSISHDLRAPLRGIDGFSHLLAEEYNDRLDDAGRNYLDRVRRAAQRMGTLIDDILELSRVTRQEMRRDEVDLSRIAAEVVEELASAGSGQRAEIVIAPGCRASGDPQLLRVVMQNLLENAWKYSARQPSPRFEFGCETIDGETVFFVRDNGVGFDMQYAGRLFTPFQRLHKPEEFEGTGIGLATIARIVHRHGGRIWVEAAPGKGAIFRFTLVAAEMPPPGTKQSMRSADSNRNCA